MTDLRAAGGDVRVESWVDMLAGHEADRLRVRYLTKAGTQRWLEITPTNRLDDPDAGYVEVEMIDVHDEMMALTAARSREAQFEALTDSLPVGVVQTDGSGEIAYANRWLRDLTSTERGSPLGSNSVPEADRSALDTAFATVMDHGRPVELDVLVHRGLDGEARSCRFRIRSLGLDDDAGRLGAIASIEDVTESLRHQQRLHDQARCDGLTGLPNRLAVNEWLEEQRLSSADPSGVTMLYFNRGLQERQRPSRTRRRRPPAPRGGRPLPGGSSNRANCWRASMATSSSSD